MKERIDEIKEFLVDMRPTWSELGWCAVLLALILAVSCIPAKADVTSYKAHAAAMEKKYNLPPRILAAVCDQESRWRNVAGRHGEIGVCQIKPTTVLMVCPECRGDAARTVFSLGSRGDQVSRIQATLARTGLYTADVDGVFGEQTHAAVFQYQRQMNLPADGIVGPQTWGALFGAIAPFPGQSVTNALWDPHANIEWAARYLAWIRDNVGSDPSLMIAAYNGGPANSVVIYLKQVRARM